MGVHVNITESKFPKQGALSSKKVLVRFHCRDPIFNGVIVRDDIESPYVTIIRLEDGRIILGTECQYQPV